MDNLFKSIRNMVISEKTKQKSFDSIALLLFEQALIQEGVKLEDTSGFVTRLNKVISETL